MQRFLLGLVLVALADASRAETVVWKLSDHLGSVDKERPAPVYNEKTSEVSMRDKVGVKYNTLQFYPKIRIEKNMAVKFSVRREIAKHEAVRFAVMFDVGENGHFYLSDAINEQSKSFTFDFADLQTTDGKRFKAGDIIREFRLYTTNKKLDPNMDMNFAVKDFRFVKEGGGIGDVIDDGLFYSRIPCFQWAPLPEGGEERLQISRTPGFPRSKVWNINLQEPLYVPEKEFSSGEWYWRYYRKDRLSDRWSNAHKFTVPSRAHTFRLPKIDVTALAEKPHPRFAGLKSALLTDGLHERVVETVKEPVPVDGSPRLGSGLSKIDWLRTVCHVVVTPTWKRLKDYGQYLLMTDDPEVKAEAIKRLMEVAKWDPKKASSEISNDLGAGNILIGMSLLFDAAYADLTPEQRDEVMDSIEARCKQFADAGVVPMTLNPAQNHTWKKTEALGVGAMALLGHREPARYWFESARNDFAYRFLPSMGFDGENQEGIAYWRYGGEMLAEFADILQAFSGDNLYEHPWLKNTVAFPIYCAPPGGYAISFADTSGNGNHTVRGPFALYNAGDFLAHLTQKTAFPYGSWYLGEEIPDTVAQRPPVDLAQDKYWDHIGWVLFNSCLPNGYEGVAVGMHSGTYFAGHQHADQNHFVINAYGDKLAIDGGAYDWYGSPHYNSYAIQTRAHNTILVDGKGQATRTKGADGKIETVYSSLLYDYTKGDASAPKIYEGRLRYFKRKLLFIKPDYVVVHDQLVATNKTAGFDWLMHSHTERPIAFDVAAKTFSIVRPLARLDGEFLYPENIGLGVKKSFTNLPCKTYSLEPRDPDQIPPDWTLSGHVQTRKGRTEYFVVMRISKTTGERVPLKVEKFETDNAFGARIAEDGRTLLVLSRKMGRKKGLLEHGDLEADADIACLELNADGNPQSAFIGQGVQLSHAGKSILQEAVRTNAHFNAREEWKSRTLEPFQLLEDTAPFDAYTMQLPHGKLHMYCGKIDVASSNTCYQIDLAGLQNPVYVHADRRIDAVPESGKISLDKGSWFVTVSSLSDLNGKQFKRIEENEEE